MAIHGSSPRTHHRRAYSDTWAFLGQPTFSPNTLTEQGHDQGGFPIPIPELQGMEIDPEGQQQQQQQQQLQMPPSLSWQTNPVQLPNLPLPPNTTNNGGRATQLPLPTTLRGLREAGHPALPLPELASPVDMGGLPNLSIPEDFGPGTNGRLLEGLDLPAPPPPPRSLKGVQHASSSSQGGMTTKAGGPATKLRVQKNTSMKRASTGVNGRTDQELMMLDPKNVKRILANRQSAAKSKERRIQHAIELEHKLAAAQEELDQVSVQAEELSLDNSTLTQYNDELSATVPQLQTQVQQLTNTSKRLVEEILQAQRVLGLPLNVPDAAIPEDNGEVLPLPSLLQPLGS
eukprot:CAMPEP_0202343364 /NCGR_PEP_ID=MMETSP1126-20121109/3515_1 /ASSEMBLY_ACC=CAM_ASM_000457 /TAXON_ID=3047 /ORGANISM="Dunaliella tertiolecta, Strain CCMP1320" /LENGTH=344 /DNA_ID=CAMNT_0048934419 /DNA_START=1582 /DNA_END=2616 /DNA_ORIENTATION=+